MCSFQLGAAEDVARIISNAAGRIPLDSTNQAQVLVTYVLLTAAGFDGPPQDTENAFEIGRPGYRVGEGDRRTLDPDQVTIVVKQHALANEIPIEANPRQLLRRQQGIVAVDRFSALKVA